MGNFYCNFTTIGPPADAVAGWLDSQRRTAYVTPTVNGRTIIFERTSDQFSEGDIEAIGASLSQELDCSALAVAVADDDELWLALYERGARVVEYSTRGPNRGAMSLSRAFGRPWLAPIVWVLLQWPYLFVEHLRHAMLAKLLGIPHWCVASGYRYISGGEPPEGLNATDLLRTGPHRKRES